jgi:heterodisulfide reductase subunit C
MDTMKTIDSKDLDPQFKNDVATHAGGENIKLCFACGTCTAGCPVSDVDSEFNPRKIIRQVLLGMRKEILSSPVIWRCVQCYSCTAKCPQNVRFREIMRALREMAVAEGAAKESLLKDVAELDRLMQKLRCAMANALTTDETKFGELKQKVEELTA